MSNHLRSIAIASLEAFVDHMNAYVSGNDFSGEVYRDGQYMILPMLNLK